MGGDEWWLGRELRALLEARAAEKAEQCCEKAACPTAPDAPEKAEKGPPAPAPVRASAARRAPGAPWDDVDDALEAAARGAAGYVAEQAEAVPVPERKELLEDGYDESQDRIVSHGLTGRMYKLVVRGQSPKPDAPGEAPAAAPPELPAGPRVRCEKKPTSGGALEALEGSSIVQIFIDEAAARFLGPARSRPAARPFWPPPPRTTRPWRFAASGASYGGLGYDGPRLAAYARRTSPTRGAPPRRGPTARRGAPRARAASEPPAAHLRRATTFSRDPNDVARHIFEGAPALGRDPSNAARHTFDGAPAPPRHPASRGRAARAATRARPQQPGAAHLRRRAGAVPPGVLRRRSAAVPPPRVPVRERRGADPVCLFSAARPAAPAEERAPSDAPPPAHARVAGSPGDPFSPG
ncbi:hypothetical protein SO694_00038237 [Aureococcus anophagefferens]|uniref:Uncharacterized protein n=1 Tax=Aureococcus anophagefferens TaxID=44056 RepID=A0ABR1FLZ8_AURAN